MEKRLGIDSSSSSPVVHNDVSAEGPPGDEKYEKIRKQKIRLVKFNVFVCVLGFFVGVVYAYRTFDEDPREVVSATRTIRQPSINTLVKDLSRADSEVRRIKETGVRIDADNVGVSAINRLQDDTRKLLLSRYGADNEKRYRVEVVLEFPASMPDFQTNGAHGKLLIELAPSDLVPHSVLSFLEMARTFEGAAFDSVSPHIVLAHVTGSFQPLAFQEYHKDYPHREGTIGFAGRPSGPHWYVNIVDNTQVHGPGGWGPNNYEADSCFGRLVKGYEDVIPRIKLMRKASKNGEKISIKEMNILMAGSGADSVDGYIPWEKDKK